LVMMAAASQARAELLWQSVRVEGTAAADQKIYHASFPFRNVGAYPVAIAEVRTSCGCTTATLDKKTFAPGEQGRIEVNFDLGERIGRQEKEVQILSDDKPNAPTVLTLVVRIPEMFSVEPRLLIWKKADTTTPTKAAVIEAVRPGTLKVLSATPEGSAFYVAIREQIAHQSYSIVLTPTSTSVPTNTLVRVTLECPLGTTRVVSIYGLVQ
jgi:hypothetical protein